MPAAIALPQLRTELKKVVAYPPVPSIPPTIGDVAGGIKLAHEVYSARRESYHSLADRKYSWLF